jgi:hypothetical protein
VVQGVVPEFKPQYHTHKKNKARKFKTLFCRNPFIYLVWIFLMFLSVQPGLLSDALDLLCCYTRVCTRTNSPSSVLNIVVLAHLAVDVVSTFKN